ncbi:MAG: RrF2 family transcriptional regulator [Planctomycetaceae bacterium]
MLTTTVEYALRAATYLASRAPKHRTTEQIADKTRVPLPYAAKVMQQLVRGGIALSLRGAQGGYALSRTPAEMTVLDVVNAVDPIRRIRACPLGLMSHASELCPLHRRMDAALQAVEESFRVTTLAEVLADPSRSKPLCGIPETPGHSSVSGDSWATGLELHQLDCKCPRRASSDMAGK